MALPTEFPVLMVPGYGNSEPDHWQGLWHSRWPGSRWTPQADWDHPEMDAWIETLDGAVASFTTPPLLIAHSLGCSTIVEWAARCPRPVLAAFLVAPPDPTEPSFPAAIEGYRNPPRQRLPFPTLVAGSTNDPYMRWDRLLAFAQEWGAEVVNFGAQGHLNLEAGLGEWPAGEARLTDFVRRVAGGRA